LEINNYKNVRHPKFQAQADEWVNHGKVNNPTASCGALGERESPHKITGKAAFVPPAS
jgi:hypothetical protein